jgi:hypothetical protein
MAEKKTIIIEVLTDEAVKQTNKLTDSLGEQKKEQGNLAGVTEVADKATGGLITKFKGLTTTLSGVTTGFKSMRVAIIATGIGALVLLLVSLAAAFASSEAGQNKFSKLMGVIGSVVGNVMDLLSDLGELVIGIFSGDAPAIKTATAFGKKLFDVIGLPVKTIITIVKSLGSAIGELASGNITGALDALSKGAQGIKDNYTDAKDAVISTGNALKGFAKDALNDAKISQDISDMRAKATKQERALLLERANADRQTAQLKEDAVNKEKFNAKERGEFLRQAQDIQEKITNKEIEVAKLRATAITEENKLSKSTTEALDAEAQAQANVIQLETARLRQNKELVSQLQGINAEEKAIATARNAEVKAALDAELKIKQDAIIAEQKLKEDQAALEAKTEEARQEAIADIRLSYTQKLEDLRDETELQKIERQEERALAELERLDATEMQLLEMKLFYLNLRDNEETRILKEGVEEREKIEKAEREFKENEYRQSFNNLQMILSVGGKGLQKVAKALAIADVIRTASKSVGESIASIGAANTKSIAASPLTAGMPFVAINTIKGALQIGATIASSARAIQAIRSEGTTAPSGSMASAGGGGGSAPIPSQTAPSFNIVGAQGLDNQIATGLGTQPTQPLRAYVVANEVTTQQSLDRNIIQNASLG